MIDSNYYTIVTNKKPVPVSVYSNKSIVVVVPPYESIRLEGMDLTRSNLSVLVGRECMSRDPDGVIETVVFYRCAYRVDESDYHKHYTREYSGV